MVNRNLKAGPTALERAMAGLASVFHDHCGSDKKLNKAELRILLDEGLVILLYCG